MDEEHKRGKEPVVNIDEAVLEFRKARQERIAIRRARIGEKIAAIRKEDDIPVVTSSSELLDEKSKDVGKTSKTPSKKKGEKEENKRIQEAAAELDKQIEDGRRHLEQMILDGEILITNVRVAAEYREKDRQQKHEESKKERLGRLHQEAEESQSMYETLSQNWAMKAEKVLPMDMFKQLKHQQEACDELLGKKDDLINYLRTEIGDYDYEYETTLEKYQKDTMLMGDRIDDLVDELRTAFVNELTLIEDYTCKNREILLGEDQEEWLNLLQQFEAMEKKNLEDRKHDAVNRFATLREMFITTKQEARDLRHKMENDARILIQEREQLKYSCHLNLEKMAYNLHILQCRSKENLQLKNMLKRLLLKLHDKFDTRAKHLRKKMELGKRHNEKLSKEIQRLEYLLDTFGQKTLHLGLSNHKKYADLWDANEEIIKEKVISLVSSDKFIFETQLGIEYPVPDFSAFENRPVALKKNNDKKSLDEYELVSKDSAADQKAEQKQSATVLTQEEIISKKLARIKYPSSSEVADYWEHVYKLLNQKGNNLWDTVQSCFEQYAKILKERNDCIVEIEKYYQQNFELSHLLNKYLEQATKCYSQHPGIGPIDSRSISLC